MSADKPNAKIQPASTGSTDHTEQRAAELARKEGRSKTGDTDRKQAMDEAEATSQPGAGLEEASH